MAEDCKHENEFSKRYQTLLHEYHIYGLRDYMLLNDYLTVREGIMEIYKNSGSIEKRILSVCIFDELKRLALERIKKTKERTDKIKRDWDNEIK